VPLTPPEPVDTRAFFRPVAASFVALLRRLPDADWDRPTIAGTWVVRDVVAHLLDTRLRRLSFHRDGMSPPPLDQITSERDFVNAINELNALWVKSSRRLSPRVLTDLYERASQDVADWFESLPLDSPALFPVSWAGEQASAGWFDIGREFTEVWHHQQQIRIAVGALQPDDPRYLGAVLEIALRGLPHAFRDVPAEAGHTLAIDITGPGGGQWSLASDGRRWTLFGDQPTVATARVTLTDDTAWKLLFNALSGNEAARNVIVEGSAELGHAFLRARSVIV
jgi:uncharacterized protein (TIGR03083 family)